MKNVYKFISLVLITATLITATASIAFGVGLTTSEGDRAIRADIARESFGVTGKGVLIGVISNSYDNLGFSQVDVDSGDLPEGIIVLQDIARPPGTSSDEGNALMQIMYDVAPGTNFIFHTGDVETQADYANAIEKLVDAGARIIVTDGGNSREPMFQDGVVAQAVDRVVSSRGVAFFTSAGNAARRSYESPFRSSDVIDPISGGVLHNFDPVHGVDTFQRVTIPTDGGFFLFTLQWDSPFASVSGGAGSPNDLDFFLYDSSGTEVLASSTQSNIGNDPLEVFSFVNNTQSTEFNLAIALKDGPPPKLLKYVVSGAQGFEINEYNTSSSTLYGFANAKGAMSVGAALYLDTPEFGVDPPVIEPFSSAGGTPILFDAHGNRLANPEIRNKPEIVAPDGVTTTFFGSLTIEGNEFPSFFGTSAAAPHAAAVAALLLELNPNLSPAEIYDILERSAIHVDDPSTPNFDIGFDFDTGYGLIQADQALTLALKRGTLIPVPPFLRGGRGDQ
ncbi:MAG: S8 family serine peptidase [Stigonema ocellatum SAG 48.90 = DSM 106950]|nr:S8 family serine peptidase [Stigonema ocellatum SAG 48.90 = DSM 106950]